MRCEHAKQMISRRIDGELDSDDSRGLHAHLAGCADCRAVATQLAIVDDRLDALVVPEAPADFSRKVSARLTDQSAYERIIRHPLAWFPHATAAGLAFAAGVLLVYASNGVRETQTFASAASDGHVADYLQVGFDESIDETLFQLIAPAEELP